MKFAEKAIRWIIREKEMETLIKTIAEIEKITPRRVNHIYKQYRETGEIPRLRKPGRSKKELSKEEINTIKEVYEEYRCNAVVLQTILKHKGCNISKNKIHEMLRMNGYAKEETESILTDRGAQFYASTGEKAKGVSKFEKFLVREWD